MKIIETQSAILSNAEVLQHVSLLQEKYKGDNSIPAKHENITTVLKQVTDYLSALNQPPPDTSSSNGNPGPSNTQPASQIAHFAQALKPYIVSAANPKGLYKHEVLMLLNLKPEGPELLDCIIEEADERFSAEEQEGIMGVVADVLGKGVRANGVDGGHDGGMEE